MKKICSVLVLGCLLTFPVIAQSSIFGGTAPVCPQGSSVQSVQSVKEGFWHWLRPADYDPCRPPILTW